MSFAMLSFSCCLILLSITASCYTQQKLNNIDFLGLGYDAIYGNPHSNAFDPGFREAVFQLEYTEQLTSSDGKWLVPDNVQALQATACSYETETSAVHGTTSYLDSLSKEVSVNGGRFFKFSSSEEYEQVRQGTSMYRRTYVFALAKCLLYHASIKRSTAARVTDEFYKSVVDGLPDRPKDLSDYSDYLRFISMFGTHYARAVEMGSKAVIRSEFEETAWLRMESSSNTYTKAAHASFRRRTGGEDSSTTTEHELAESFDSNRSSVAAAFLGSQPSSDGNWKTWMAATAVSPYPIAYELRPLTDLFTTQYFPNISNNILSTRRTLLETAYNEYCQGIATCRTPDVDKIPVSMHRADFGVANRVLTRVSCRPGMYLLSCGLENLPVPISPDQNRCAVPVDSTTCECLSSGAVCQPWCTSFNIATDTISLPTSSVTRGLFRTDCRSPRKQVVGCAVDMRRTSATEYNHYAYPAANSSSCLCSSSNGAVCYAQCATGIRNYEIVSESGRGNITVQCSPSNYVFSCGIQAVVLGEQMRTATVSSSNSCKCYDSKGAICYAICGQFS